MKLITTAAVALTAGLAGVGTAAEAAGSTCTSTVSNSTVSQIVVAQGRTCRLSDVTVTGNVTVQPGATLVATGTTVRGTVDVRPKARATFRASSVAGQFTAFYAQAVLLDHATLGSGLKSNGRPGGLGYDPEMPNNVPVVLRLLNGTKVAGGLDLHGTRLTVADSSVGSVTGGWNHAMTLRAAKVNGSVELANFREGAVTICGSTVSGDVSLSRGNYGAFLGQPVTRGANCAGNTFKGALAVNEMYGVRASRNTVAGLASGVNPANMAATGVVGSRNRFLGGAQGDFALASLGG